MSAARKPHKAEDAEQEEGAYGHTAERPVEIPRRGWKQIAIRVFQNLGAHNTALLAAGVATFGLLAAFPALNVAVTLYALFASVDQIMTHLEPLQELLPDQAFRILRNQLTTLAEASGAAVNFALAGSVLFGLWSARKGAAAVITACNVAYGEPEQRPLWRVVLVSFAFTVGGILGLVLLALLAVALPVVLSILPLGEQLAGLIGFLRWPLLAVLFILALQVIYRFAPSRENPKWRWVSWGAVIATLLWLGASLLFSAYVQSFGKFNETYGAIGSVVILILWFQISAFSIILGAEINAEIEHQTEVDSTTGEDRPMGERGAYVADTSTDTGH